MVNNVDMDLKAWCRSQAGMTQLASNGDNERNGVVPNEMTEDDEVEAVGECDIFEI